MNHLQKASDKFAQKYQEFLELCASYKWVSAGIEPNTMTPSRFSVHVYQRAIECFSEYHPDVAHAAAEVAMSVTVIDGIPYRNIEEFLKGRGV